MPGPGDVSAAVPGAEGPQPRLPRPPRRRRWRWSAPAAGEARITLREGLEDADARVSGVLRSDVVGAAATARPWCCPFFKKALTDKDAGVRATAALCAGADGEARRAGRPRAEGRLARRRRPPCVFHAAQALWGRPRDRPGEGRAGADQNCWATRTPLCGLSVRRCWPASARDAKAAVNDLIAILQTDEPAVRGPGGLRAGGRSARTPARRVPALIEAFGGRPGTTAASGPRAARASVRNGPAPPCPPCANCWRVSAPDLQARVCPYPGGDRQGCGRSRVGPDQATQQPRGDGAVASGAGVVEDRRPDRGHGCRCCWRSLEHKDHRFRLGAVKTLGTIGHPAVVTVG